MMITSITNHFLSTPDKKAAGIATSQQDLFKNLLMNNSEDIKKSSFSEKEFNTQTDFRDMTGRNLFEWMNNEIRAGKLTLDESTPFLAMTMKISVATGDAVNISTDERKRNFIDRAQQGIEGAIARNDKELVMRLRAALNIMYREHGETFSIDTQA